MSNQSDEFASAGEPYEKTEVTDLESLGMAPETVDDTEPVRQEDWMQIADFVEATAHDLVNEILDVDALADSAVGLDFDSTTLSDLREAIRIGAIEPPTPPPPPSGPAPGFRDTDTDEVEFVDQEDEEPEDFFDATGIEFIDVETGELIVDGDIRDVKSGPHELPPIPPAPSHSSSEQSADPSKPRAQKLLALKFGEDESLELSGIWGRYLAELKAEILAEPDRRHRAAYVFVFVNVVRALTGRRTNEAVALLGELSDESGAVLRSTLLERLAARWSEADDSFFELLDRIEELDDGTEGSLSTIRRSSVVMERLMERDLPEPTQERLRGKLIPPETFPTLVVKAIEGHASGNLANSIAAWRRLAKHAHGDLKRAAASLLAYYLHDSPSFFDITGQLIEETPPARGFLMLVQREALDKSNRWEEARVLKRLIAQDVKMGRRLRGASDDARRRLRRETAGRLFRLSTLLSGLKNVDYKGTDLEGMTEYAVLRDAVSMHASNLVLLRRLERWGRERNDWETVSQSLVSQASIVDDPAVQALIWERLAFYHSETTGDVRSMSESLGQALKQDPDCLPALISWGQQLILKGDLDDMLDLRGVPEGEELRAVNGAWRRAELLERTDGDPREILALYRSARDDQPQSVHLFFCVERALARLADWRGLRTLYDAAAPGRSPLGQKLEEAGLEIDTSRLVVETFLEDAPEELHTDWLAYLARRRSETDDYIAHFDESIEWRVAARAVEAGEIREISRWVEELVFETRDEVSLRRSRLRLWHTWLADRFLEDRGAAIEGYRELYLSARGIFQRRFSIQGLLRCQDFAWLAESMLREERGLWGWAHPEVPPNLHEAYLKRVAAELFALGGQHDRTLQILAELAEALEDEAERATTAERAVHHAMRSMKWAKAFQFLPACFKHEDPRTLAEFSRHLAVALEDPRDALDGLDEAGGFTSSSPVVLLDEIELAYRAHEWQRLSQLLNRALATAEAGSIGFRAFVLEQVIINATWGYEGPELALTSIEDLWSLEAANPGTSPIFAVAAFIRTYAWLGRQDELDEWLDYARSNFTPAVAEGLEKEAEIMQATPGGERAAEWYRSQVGNVAGPLKPYYRWMAAVLEWLFGTRDYDVAAELSLATSEGDPTHRLGTFFVTIALRDVGEGEAASRHFRMLRRAGNSRPVQSWALIRSLFHTAVTLRRPQDAIQMVEDEEAYLQLPWINIATELFGRSLRRTAAVERLRERSKDARGGRALMLEHAQILGDVGMFPRLASEGEPGAQVLTELLAAQGERPHAPGWSIEIRHADLERSIAEESQEQVRRRLMAFLLEVDEVFWGSPWCPLRLTRGDLTRFGLSLEELKSLEERVSNFQNHGVGAEARLVVAREFQRMGRRDVAINLMPEQMGVDAPSVAWSMLGVALDPFTESERSASWMLDFWGLRRERLGDADICRAEVDYEIGHAYEQVGKTGEAVQAYERSLEARPTFLPSQVGAGRILIHAEAWADLARLLENQLDGAQNADVEASIAFRLGYLYDRRLRGEPEADVRAEDFYLRVLRHRGDHLPSLEALLDLSFRQHNYDAAAQYLARLSEITDARGVEKAYLLELATLFEHRLDDLDEAARVYNRVLELDPHDILAFQGLMRTDLSGRHSIRAISTRLEMGVSPREIEDLGHILFALSSRSEAAQGLLAERFADHYPALVVRLCDAVLHTAVDSDALAALERAYLDSETRFLCYVIERMGRPRPLAEEALLQASRVSNDPILEGRLVRAMHYAWREEDLESLGLLATARARRAQNPLVRSAELTWMVATQQIRGDLRSALDVCERLLTQYMDFLPAVKLAKLLAAELEEWQSVVRWYKRDAHLSRVAEISAEDRLLASAVQRDHLGDLDSAVNELEKVIESNPRHPDAFERLKDLLHTRRDFARLLDAYENQIRHSDDDDEICTWLNEMSEVAIRYIDEPNLAIQYLSRSLDRKPRQRRRLRVLAELYEDQDQFSQAVSCYRGAAELSDEPDLLHRLWSHIGHLYEQKLSDLDKSKAAYLKALGIDRSDCRVLVALARICEARMELQESLRYLGSVLEISLDNKVLRDARISIVRVESKAGATIDELLQSARRILLHHPEHLDTVDDIVGRLQRAGRESEAPEYFREITVTTLRNHPERPIAPHFDIARRVGLEDRAFCISSMAHHHGQGSAEMEKFYAEHALPRRWPRRPIPVDQTGELVPEDLVAPFLEVLRITSEGVAESLEYVPGTEHIRRANRQKEARGLGLSLAFQWPQLFGLELRDVHMADEAFGDGSEIVLDGGVRLVLDKRWKDTKDPTELLVGSGRKLAAWSMGVGLWGRFDAEAGVALFVWVISRFVSGWSMGDRKPPEIVNTPRFARWLNRKGQRVAPYALEISGRFGAAAVEKQFYLLHQAFERFSLVCIDDPGLGLKYSRLRGSPELGDMPWLFLFGAPPERIRDVLGISVT